MWLQKKNICPICRRNIDEIVQLYFPNEVNKNNSKLQHLYYNVKYVKLDNYGQLSKKCLICGSEEPKEQLLICDFCNFFQAHIFCDPSNGIAYGKYFCPFCRKKFIESLKNK